MKQLILATSSEEQAEQVSEALVEECKETIFKLRRLRLQMERATGKKTEDLLFSEHKGIDYRVESVEFEKVNEYASLSKMDRLGKVENNEADHLIRRIVYRWTDKAQAGDQRSGPLRAGPGPAGQAERVALHVLEGRARQHRVR